MRKILWPHLTGGGRMVVDSNLVVSKAAIALNSKGFIDIGELDSYIPSNMSPSDVQEQSKSWLYI